MRCADIEMIYGDHLVGAEDTGDGVLVTIATAAPRRFDLVIEADRMMSSLRSLVFGPNHDFIHPFRHGSRAIHRTQHHRSRGLATNI